MTETLKIDAHVHVFTTDMPLIDNPRHAPKYSFTHDELIATLDKHGVERAVIAAASPWGDYNDYILAALRAHPKRLRGTAIVKPTDRPLRARSHGPRRHGRRAAAVHRSAEAARHHDLRLSRVVPPPRRPRLARPSSCRRRRPAENPADAWKRRASRSWSIISAGPIRARASTATASRRCCARSTRAAPGSRFRAAIGSARRPWNTRASLFASPGADRLVWASDCPFVGHEGQFPYQATIDWLNECVPDAAARAKIFGETARKLYFNGQ